MVKFAEAEKRRGGDGSDKRFAPAMMLERQKISRGMWESLKAHIMKERRKKKEEIEADAEEKRMRKEQENRKKQHAMTLEGTKEQKVKADQKLNDLKAQKHELVQQLKKVLNEETRIKEQEQQKQQLQQQQQQQAYLQENDVVPLHPYSHGSLSVAHPQILFPSNMVSGRTGNIPAMYKVAVPTSQNIQTILPGGSIKRSRSPSPQPAQSTYQQLPFVLKNFSTQTSVVPVSLTTAKANSGTSVFLSNPPPSSYYHSSPSTQFATTTHSSAVGPYLSSHSGVSLASPQVQAADKQLQSIYLTGGRAPTNVATIHPAIDHKGKNSHSSSYGEGQDKFYVSTGGVRPHLVLHHTGVLPVQSHNTKGGITSGFPQRTQPSTQGQSSHNYTLNLPRSYF